MLQDLIKGIETAQHAVISLTDSVKCAHLQLKSAENLQDHLSEHMQCHSDVHLSW